MNFVLLISLNSINIFLETTNFVINSLGEKPFNIIRGFNVAAFDSVFTVIAENMDKLSSQNLVAKYEDLKTNDDFIKNITSATTDEKTVSERFRLSENILLG